MSPKAQHGPKYHLLPLLLKRLREEAGLTQRQLGTRIGKPQSWVYNCETANRRVDVTEFVQWAKACKIEPEKAFSRLLDEW